MDRGAWWATVHGVERKLDMTERLNDKLPLTWSQDQPSESFQIGIYFLLLYLYLKPASVEPLRAGRVYLSLPVIALPWVDLVSEIRSLLTPSGAVSVSPLLDPECLEGWAFAWSPGSN